MRALRILTEKLVEIIGTNAFDLCVYGSTVMDDFHLGISDIDILVLTHSPLSDDQGALLLNLRGEMFEESRYEECKYFEGAITNGDTFIKNIESIVVYWGTSGQRLEKLYHINALSRFELIEYGKIIYGNDFRNKISTPSYDEIIEEVKRHLQVIRKYGAETSESIHSIGWLFDIARGLYTLETGDVATKTAAAKWAIQNGLVIDRDILEKAVSLRLNPKLFGTYDYPSEWFVSLGEPIQRFADVLERKLEGI